MPTWNYVYVENNFFRSLKKTSHQRNWHNKKLHKFAKLHFLNDKIYKKAPFSIWKFGKTAVAVNFNIPKLKFCKVDQLFFVSVSLVKGCFEGTRENIFDIFRAIIITEVTLICLCMAWVVYVCRFPIIRLLNWDSEHEVHATFLEYLVLSCNWILQIFPD